MKKRHVFVAGLSLLSIVLSGCHIDNTNVNKYSNDKRYDIYLLAVSSGYSGTYEEWLASIKGKDGVDGHSPVISLGENGNWFIDGVDTGVSAKGSKGEPGKDGADGKDGRDGVDGTNGKDGIDGKNGTNGQDGKDGVDGKDGKDGTNGKDGTSVLTGNGVPNNNLGKVGDSYIDLENWNYYVKEENGWILKGNIKGEGAVQSEEHDGSIGLEFYPLKDGTYAESIGQAIFLEEIRFASIYKGVPVTKIVSESDGRGDYACQKVVIPEGIKEICSGGLSSFGNMTSLSLPKSLETIAEYSIPTCNALTEVKYAGTIAEFEALNKFNVTWYNCDNLHNITCSDGEIEVVDEVDRDTIKFVMSYNQEVTNVFTNAITRFKELHPNLDISLERQASLNDMQNYIMGKTVTGDMPDVYIGYADYVPDLISGGYVKELSDLLNNDSDFKSKIYPTLLKEGSSYQVEGLYSLPLTVNTDVIYYNKDAVIGLDLSSVDNTINGGNPLDEAYINSLTWEEMFTKLLPAIKTFNTNSGNSLYNGAKAPLQIDNDMNLVHALAKQKGISIENVNQENGTVNLTFNNSELKAAFAEFKSYYDAGLFTTKSISGSYSSNLFVNKEILFAAATTNSRNYFTSNLFTTGVAKYPTTGENGYQSVQGATQFVILKDNKFETEHAAQAYEFYKLLMEEYYLDLYNSAAYYPATTSQKETLVNFYNTNKETIDGNKVQKLNYDLSLGYDVDKLVNRYYYHNVVRIKDNLAGLFVSCMTSNLDQYDTLFTNAYNNSILNLL